VLYLIIPIGLVKKESGGAMKLSTKARYGVRAMFSLALNYGKGAVPLKAVAEQQEISEKYLEHLMGSLRSAGLVRSVRGTHGGYILAKSPFQIKLDEVVRVLEGPIVSVECVDDPSLCRRVRFCVTRDIWGQVKEAMEAVLESTTLQDLVERQKEREQPGGTMYYI